jgi:hypothetical protein
LKLSRRLLDHFYRFQGKQIIFWGALAAMIIVCYIQFIFFHYDFSDYPISMAIVATLIKHHFAILFVVVTAGFIFGYGGFLEPIFRNPIFRVMGR